MRRFFYCYLILWSIPFCFGTTAIAERAKIGNWNVSSQRGFCSMYYNGWGKNLEITYIEGSSSTKETFDISFSGIRIKNGNLWRGGSKLIVESSNGSISSFFHHNEGGLNGVGVNSFNLIV